MLCYNVDPSSLGTIYLNNQSISIVSHDKHLGNYISTYIHDRNIIENVCDLYQRSNSIFTEFHACDSETLDSLHLTFCMHMYGCELSNLTSSYIDKYIIAWRKIKRRIWEIPPTSHKYIVHNLSSDCKKLLEKLIIKFIHNALNNNNMCAQILKVKLRCKNSSFADNYRYLSYKYNLTNSDWINDIGSLLAKVEIKSHSGINNLDVSTVKELCHMRDNSYYNILSYDDLN